MRTKARNITVQGKHYTYQSAHKDQQFIGIYLRTDEGIGKIIPAKELFAPLNDEQRMRPLSFGGRWDDDIAPWVVENYIKNKSCV